MPLTAARHGCHKLPDARRHLRAYAICILSALIFVCPEVVTGKLSRRPAPRPLTADAPFSIEDWFGEHTARLQIGGPTSKSTVVVIADDLDLGDRQYNYLKGTAPKNIIIIADTLRLSGVVQIDLSGKASANVEKRSGGQLMIFARHVICAEGAKIAFHGIPTFYSSPFNPPTSSGTLDLQNVPQAGRFFFGAESLELTAALKENILQRTLQRDDLLPQTTREPLSQQKIDGIASLIDQTYDDAAVRRDLRALVGSKSTFDNELIDLVFTLRAGALEHALKLQPNEVFQTYLAAAELEDPDMKQFTWMPKPTPGIFRTANKAEALVQFDPGFKLPLSEWVVRWHRAMARRITEARIKGDRAALYQAFDAVEHFPGYPIDSEAEARYLKILGEIQKAQADAKLGLIVEAVNTSTTGSLPVQLDAYAEGTSLDYRVGPTNVLLREYSIGGKRKLGLYRFDSAHPNELEFYITADLTVNPALSKVLDEYFRKRSFRYAGQFTRWDLHFLGFDTIPGIVSEKSTVTVSGSLLQAKLVIDKTGTGLVQWSTAGLPLKFSWEYLGDSKIGGTLRNLLLKRGTRAEPLVSVVGGVATNNSALPVRLRYALAGDGRLLDFTPQFVELESGKSATLPLPASVDPATVKIPAEAVESIYRDVRDFDQDFFGINDEQLAEEVTVSNELTINNVPEKGPIDYVEVRLVYASDASGGAPQQWSVNLLPSPHSGAVARRWFFRDKQGNRNIALTGTLHYMDGSSQALKPLTTTQILVRIGTELIPQP
jgi:hypothetical protein